MIKHGEYEVAEKPNHPAFKDLEGQRFTRLLVLGFYGLQWRNAVWICQCDCGTIKPVKSGQLIQGKTKSCGCYKDEKLVQRVRTHGHSRSYSNTRRQSPAYASWLNMKTRCLNKNSNRFIDYGGRGITICDQWMNSFETFLKDMGEPEDGQSIDRINNNGNYEPENCRWATQKEQCNNTRRCRFVNIDGNRFTVMQASEKYGISEFSIYNRLNRGFKDRDAVFGVSKK